MARFYREGFDDRLDDRIRKAEAALDALYAQRAGRRNSRKGDPIYGWIYCACGRTNEPDGMHGTCCDTCKQRGEIARALETLRAHDAGEHAIAPLAECSGCHYAARVAATVQK